MGVAERGATCGKTPLSLTVMEDNAPLSRLYQFRRATPLFLSLLPTPHFEISPTQSMGWCCGAHPAMMPPGLRMTELK